MTQPNHRIDELLELMWMLREENKLSTEEVERQSRDPELADLLKQTEDLNYISYQNGDLSLTPAGEEKGREITRRHRLAECLLMDVLEVGEERTEETACAFEHILDAAVTERVCTFLGHPPTCPHGRPIPPGPCCLARTEEMKPLVMRLIDLEPGTSGKIVLIAPRQRERYDKLSTFGLTPGSVVQLLQRHPSCVVRVGETELALDASILSEIYVRPV